MGYLRIKINRDQGDYPIYITQIDIAYYLSSRTTASQQAGGGIIVYLAQL